MKPTKPPRRYSTIYQKKKIFHFFFFIFFHYFFQIFFLRKNCLKFFFRLIRKFIEIWQCAGCKMCGNKSYLKFCQFPGRKPRTDQCRVSRPVDGPTWAWRIHLPCRWSGRPARPRQPCISAPTGESYHTTTMESTNPYSNTQSPGSVHPLPLPRILYPISPSH